MPANKQKRNGFWYFMVEYKEREEKRGRSFPNGFQDIQADPKCSQEWNTLTNEEKQRYNDRAKRDRRRDGKRTTLGESILIIEEEKRKKMEFEANMKFEIDEKIHLAESCNSLQHLSFFFIHVNYFYSKQQLDSTVDYVPAEMAICEFTIAEGVVNYYHQIINVTVELGYARETLEHSDATHKIPIDLADGERDYGRIYKKFRKFLAPTENKTGRLPPIYTSKKYATVVTCFMERMTRAAGVPDDTFSLYSLEYLYGVLMNICNQELPRGCNPTILAECELEKGAFAYSPNIECNYHHRIDGTSNYCSLAVVRQWAFTICDYCCGTFGIKLIADVHCPGIYLKSDIDSLSSSFGSLNVERKISSLKSSTGVSEIYRHTVAGRTAREAEERRREALLKPLTIIDHSKTQAKPGSIIVPSASVSKAPRFLKPLRAPKNILQAVTGTNNVPELNDSNFPSIGGGRGHIAPVLQGELKKKMEGKGRGGIYHL